MGEVAVPSQWAVSAELRTPGLTYERFEEICAFLGVVNTEVRFAIGDALLLGPEHFGEEAYQALELLNISEESKKEYLRVSRQVPPTLRRRGVDWSHHRAVAALPTNQEKREWLRKVAEDGLSHHALRDALRNGAPPKEVSECRCCGRPL